MRFCYNIAVDQVSQLLSHYPLIAIFAALAAFLAVALVINYVWSAPVRAERRADDLSRLLTTVTETLGLAERIGKFGSFRWDYREQAASYWSDEMYALFGLVRRKAPPSIDVFVDAAHPGDKDRVKQLVVDATTKPGEFSCTFRAVAPDKSVRYLRVQGTSVVPEQHKADRITGVAQDVTKEMEVDQAKSEFVSLASHQLKTPLTSIRWLVEAVQGGAAGQLSPEQKSFFDKIQQSTLNMIAIVNDLLNVSRIEMNRLATQLEELDVMQVAQSVIDEQKHAADAHHIALALAGSGLPHIQADRNSLRMIFQNLISNAIKYTPDGGSVSVNLTLAGARQQAIYLEVSDTGIGIPKDEQDRVFEKLHRAKNAQSLAVEGTGLGLYVVKTVIEKAGGEITFESKEGKGTTFTVTIPLTWKLPPSTGVSKLA